MKLLSSQSLNNILGVVVSFVGGLSACYAYASWKKQQQQLLFEKKLNDDPKQSIDTNIIIANLPSKARIFCESYGTILNLAWLVAVPSIFLHGNTHSSYKQSLDRFLLWSLVASNILLRHNDKCSDDKSRIKQAKTDDKTDDQPEKKIITDDGDEKNEANDDTPIFSDVSGFIPPPLIRIHDNNSIPTKKKINTEKPLQYLELLVHNVAHSDLVLSMDVDVDKNSNQKSVVGQFDMEKHCLARPKFSTFQKYSKLVLQNVMTQKDGDTKSSSETSTNQQNEENSILYLPRFLRLMDDPRYKILQSSTDELPLAPAGIRLSNPLSCKFNKRSLHNEFKIRTKDIDKLDDFIRQQRSVQSTTDVVTTMSEPSSDCFDIDIGHAFFPHLATLLPVWEQSIAEKQYATSSVLKRVLILVTGVGSPRNMTHAVAGNSTKYCGELIKYFVEKTYPDVTVVQVHSDTNLFRYDENLVFVERDLMPTIDIYRDALATGSAFPDEKQVRSAANRHHRTTTQLNFTNDEWRKQMNVTLSFADGAPARTTAIQASTRYYKPSYFHFWQRKTFWYEEKIVDDDIEVQSFEAMMETSPAKDADQIQDKHIQMVTQEMKAFYNEMVQTLSDSNDKHDLNQFWLRKTKKPVLAVLLVLSPGMKEPRLFRGTNMEVSMPTGSLCAERNVIGSALSSNPHLKRQDLKLIAVLAVPLIESDTCIEVSNEGMPFGINHVTSYSSIVDLIPNGVSSRKHSVGSEFDDPTASGHRHTGSIDCKQFVQALSSASVGTLSFVGEKSVPLDNWTNSRVHTKVGTSGTSTPIRKIPLFPSGNTFQTRNSKRAVLIHSNKDINPLKPCGACNEWLKKIAESNPYFRIITFTDANCNGIYVSPCQE